MSADQGRQRQASIYIRGLSGIRPRVPVDAAALEAAARRALSREAFAYLAGGAGAERTLRANRAALDAWRIVPRVLRDVSARDMGIELFGRRLPAPVLLAPIGVLELAHRSADIAVARAAAALGLPFIFSTQASVAMEACAAAMGNAPRWFQLYWSRSDELVRSFVRRAEQCGCEAIVVTLDTHTLGWRARDLDLAWLPFLHGMGIAQYTSDPVFRELMRQPLDAAEREKLRLTPRMLLNLPRVLRNRTAVQHFLATFSRPSLSWNDLAFLRDLTKLPILLKGILHADDARQAIARGMDGVIVSNHGGRQIDGAIGALDALPPIVAAVGDRVPVLFDSGVRGGADVFKALALGATAVCIGRPYAYGLAIAGEAGVKEVLENVIAELDITMGLSGCASVRAIDRSALSALDQGFIGKGVALP